MKNHLKSSDIGKMNRHLRTTWELNATKDQLKIRDRIEAVSKRLYIPPSEIEFYFVRNGKIKENWADQTK